LIKKGEIAALLPGYDDVFFMCIKEGYFFGETDLLFNDEVH
jgi:hypothetical protein